MKAIFLYASNSKIPESHRLNYYPLSSEFDLVIGKEYIVHAQSIFRGSLYYLIDPLDDDRPSWFPAEAFSLSEKEIPRGWLFAVYPEDFHHRLGAIWGYKKLVDDPDHYDALLERDPDARQAFHAQRTHNRET